MVNRHLYSAFQHLHGSFKMLYNRLLIGACIRHRMAAAMQGAISHVGNNLVFYAVPKDTRTVGISI